MLVLKVLLALFLLPPTIFVLFFALKLICCGFCILMNWICNFWLFVFRQISFKEFLYECVDAISLDY